MVSVTVIRQNNGGGRDSLCLRFEPPVFSVRDPDRIIKLERLSLTVYRNPGSDGQKAYNSTMAALAGQARQKRLEDIAKGRLVPLDNEHDFLHFYRICASKVGYNMTASLAMLQRFCAGTCPYSAISPDFCEKYRRFLLDRTRDGLSRNTAMVYFRQFHKVLKLAFQSGRTDRDYTEKLERIQPTPDADPAFISDKELKALADTPCSNRSVRATAFLSVLYGLRFGEIQGIRWQDIRRDRGRTRVTVLRHRARPIEINLTEEALSLLPPRSGDGYVLSRSCYAAMVKGLNQWAADAGISRPLTFEMFRKRTLDSLKGLK